MIHSIIYWTGALVWVLFALAALQPWHKKLLKWLPYGWIVESITYPYSITKLKLKLKRMNHQEAAQYWGYLRQTEYWWTSQWFGRRFFKIVEQYVLDTAPKK